MKICYGVMAQITHFRFLRISPLIFATVQKFALDYLRDQQILTPPCEWGLAVVVPLLGKTLEVEDSPGMVCSNISTIYPPYTLHRIKKSCTIYIQWGLEGRGEHNVCDTNSGGDVILHFNFIFNYRVSQKKYDPCLHGHNSSEIHQKGEKLVCFRKFSLNAAEYLGTKPLKIGAYSATFQLNFPKHTKLFSFVMDFRGVMAM